MQYLSRAANIYSTTRYLWLYLLCNLSDVSVHLGGSNTWNMKRLQCSVWNLSSPSRACRVTKALNKTCTQCKRACTDTKSTTMGEGWTLASQDVFVDTITEEAGSVTITTCVHHITSSKQEVGVLMQAECANSSFYMWHTKTSLQAHKKLWKWTYSGGKG